MQRKKRKGTNVEQFTIEEMVDAILAANGSRIDAADTLGCGVMTIWNYEKKYPRVAEALEEADKVVGQLCRNAILDGVMAGDAGCAKWFLTHNKHNRSDWVERTEISGVDGKAIEQNVTIKADTPPAANSIEEWIEVRKRVQAARAEVVEAAE